MSGPAAPHRRTSAGPTAEFADVQDTISADFLRVAAITIVGILIVLILLLRALVAPVYLVLTVLLSYAMSLSLSALILQHVFGQPGINYFIPLMVFVLLVALGSDYNIFLMSRVREESATRPLRPGIRVASARTGTVITSAGLILAGTFGALVDLAAAAALPGRPDGGPGRADRHVRRPEPARPGDHGLHRRAGLVAVPPSRAESADAAPGRSARGRRVQPAHARRSGLRPSAPAPGRYLPYHRPTVPYRIGEHGIDRC